MRDKLGPGTTLSYCTNVHPSTGLSDLAKQLSYHAAEVKRLVGFDGPMGIGVWVPFDQCEEDGINWKSAFGVLKSLLTGNQIPKNSQIFRHQLQSIGLEAVTANAFPFHAFHDEVVKHRVYSPDWTDEDRVWYTSQLSDVFSMNPPPPHPVSISTLPIGFEKGNTKIDREEAASRLCQAISEISFSTESSPRFTLDLEPEPGCILDSADDVIAFFDEHLPGELHRKHIGVCHDVCHTAVMFEDQRDVLRRYAEAGISVNKVQISSALDVDVATIGVETAIQHLKQFDEPRYLHQTGILHDAADPKSFELIEDLPEAIERLEAGETPDRLRVHFHVPVYLDSIGPLGTTNNQIAEAVAAAREYHDTKHFEVETYAWGVLPDHLKRGTLAEGIADELKWVLKTCGA